MITSSGITTDKSNGSPPPDGIGNGMGTHEISTAAVNTPAAAVMRTKV
jgi:hypothetical protein